LIKQKIRFCKITFPFITQSIKWP